MDTETVTERHKCHHKSDGPSPVGVHDGNTRDTIPTVLALLILGRHGPPLTPSPGQTPLSNYKVLLE